MLGLNLKDANSVTRKPTRLFMKDSNGTTRKLKSLWMKDTNGVNRKIFQSGPIASVSYDYGMLSEGNYPRDWEMDYSHSYQTFYSNKLAFRTAIVARTFSEDLVHVAAISFGIRITIRFNEAQRFYLGDQALQTNNMITMDCPTLEIMNIYGSGRAQYTSNCYFQGDVGTSDSGTRSYANNNNYNYSIPSGRHTDMGDSINPITEATILVAGYIADTSVSNGTGSIIEGEIPYDTFSIKLSNGIWYPINS